MIFLLDENFPKSAAEHLRGLGHTVYDSRALGLSGATDALILKKSVLKNSPKREMCVNGAEGEVGKKGMQKSQKVAHPRHQL